MRVQLIALTAVATLATASVVSAQGLQSTAPAAYDAITDRGPRAEPTLPSVGTAGSRFNDPVFGNTITRITDARTRPGLPNRSYRSPSGTHQNAWSADGRFFYVVSTDGTIVPFAFDAATGGAARVNPREDGDGGLVLRFYIEPHFSYTRPGIIYGSFSGSGASLRSIDQFDFSTGEYSRILDLNTLAPDLSGTYVGGIGASGGDTERLIAFFGGSSQDRHRYLVVFDKDGGNRRLLDTRASTVDGRRTSVTLDFNLHAAAIDRSGRYVMLYPTAADLAAPRRAAANYLWDTANGTFTELGVSALPGGHDAYGHGLRVNQDCCVTTTWDAAQWQLRALASPLVTRDVIVPVLNPKEIYLAEHASWHNAPPDRFVPYVSALYRYGANTTEWRAWDDEIVAIQTELSGNTGAEVWRLAHHRSDVRDDRDPGRIAFWYTPRPNLSPDGRWVLFTSNWEKTLGTDPAGDAGTAARQDVFLLALKGTGTGEPSRTSAQITTTELPRARRNKTYLARLRASGAIGAMSWAVASGTLPTGLALSANGILHGKPTTTGSWTFTVSLTDTLGTVRKPFTLLVVK